MPGKVAGLRNRLFRGIHAEASKRGMDHDALHAMAKEQYGAHSLSALTDAQLLNIYHGWTGKVLRRQAKLGSPGWKNEPPQMISGEEVVALDQEFATRALSGEGRKRFVRRQLKGRDQVRTRGDYIRVLHALRAMNQRDAEAAAAVATGESGDAA
jgi:hypothetical protein